MKKIIIMSLFASLLTACASTSQPSIATVPKVDLPKFMGDWYVIAAIPTAIETDAYNAVENYQLNKDGTIATTFTYNKGSFDGKVKTYHPKGFVIENSENALWGMQFIWPIKAEYRIAYLDPAYTKTIIARNARDYVWIMARKPALKDAEYLELTNFVKEMGYDLSKLRKVPQAQRPADHSPVEKSR
ncbi:MAG: lipocalin family protein [Methylotenera sp.]|nr:lipocalin family protein [Methylotenera sp.]